jgi:hypothetical protein
LLESILKNKDVGIIGCLLSRCLLQWTLKLTVVPDSVYI